MPMVSGIQIKSIVKVAKLVETTSPGQEFINQDLIRGSGVTFGACTHRDYIRLLYKMVLQSIVFYSNTAIVGYQETCTTVQEIPLRTMHDITVVTTCFPCIHRLVG